MMNLASVPSVPPRKPAKVIRKEAFYPYEPAVVWGALTRGEAMAQWLMPNNFPDEPRVGSTFQFRIDPVPIIGGRIDCEILEFEPPRLMAWRWEGRKANGASYGAMRIEWELVPENGGTRLHFRQHGAEALPWIMRLMMNFGWGTMLKRWLPKVLGAFERTGGGLVYRRMEKAPNRGHHKTKTIPPEFHK